MKKPVIILILLCVTTFTYAKKVKFACDMTGITVLTTGMHVSGDFQTAAGFAGGDWNSASTPLTQEPGTDIYSIVVDIPAFTKYEYKFVNGDQFYEAEFVPEYSRVLYNFNDNRWLYVDSLANDTTFAGAIIFGGNAPAGMLLARFYVNMQNEIVAGTGVHMAADFQGWNPASTYLYSFGQSIHEVIAYVTAGTYSYRFYNGNNSSAGEMVPAVCSNQGNREINVTSDTLIGIVCFSSCNNCVTGISENGNPAHVELFPNPASRTSTLNIQTSASISNIIIRDIAGRVVREYTNINSSIEIERGSLEAGMYFINVYENSKCTSTAKLLFE